jgi:hypothetical protein
MEQSLDLCQYALEGELEVSRSELCPQDPTDLPCPSFICSTDVVIGRLGTRARDVQLVFAVGLEHIQLIFGL